jgi:uncharacterized protein YjiS (DUF1127 family)
MLIYIHFNDEASFKGWIGDTRRLPMLLSLIRMIQAFRDYQRNVSELSQLSDRELADIGLDRSDIPRVAAGTHNGWSLFSRLLRRITPASLRALSYPALVN